MPSTGNLILLTILERQEFDKTPGTYGLQLYQENVFIFVFLDDDKPTYNDQYAISVILHLQKTENKKSNTNFYVYYVSL